MSLFETETPVSGGSNDFPNAEQLKFTAPGQAIEGEILDVSGDIQGDYKPFKIAVVRSAKDGKEYKVLLGSVLKDKFERANASVGGQIGIRFEGLKKTKTGGREYKDWTVVYKPPAGLLESGGVASQRPSSSLPF